MTTVAGAGAFGNGFVDGVGVLAKFYGPSGISIDPTGTYALVADLYNKAVRMIIIASRTVSTLAGGSGSGSADGAGAVATFVDPNAVAIDPTGSFAIVVSGSGL